MLRVPAHLLCLLSATLVVASVHAQQVVVVGGNTSAPYQATTAEVSAAARNAGLAAISLPETMLPQALRMGTVSPADVYVALGARALAATVAAARPGNALSCLTTERSGLPGVILTHPARARIGLLKRLLPRTRQVGVLFSPQADRQDLAALEAAAAASGMEIVAKPVDEKNDLDKQLDRLANEVDALLATYDLSIHSAKNAPRLIRFSYQHRIPLIGMSSSWAKAGALAGLDWDYKDLAEQCASMALRIARGERVAGEVRPPRMLVYSINASTARQLNIALPEEALRGAHATFE